MSDRDVSFLEPVAKTMTSVLLPSRGILYTGELAKGKVGLTAMTLLEEAMLSTMDDTEKAVDNVIRRCILDPSHVDMRELIASDKFFLMLVLRAITFGSKYSFTWTCRNRVVRNGIYTPCGASNRFSVNIPDDFRIKTLNPEDKEPYMVELPDSKRVIGVRLLRGFDEQEIDAYEKRLPEANKHELPAYVVSRQIVSVDGNQITPDIPKEKVLKFVASLSAKDIAVLRDKIEYYTPGIDTTVNVTCARCGNSISMDLPLSAGFFRPEPSDQSGEDATEV